MNCPTCTVPLLISERQGIEIDYCPQCRGVWLDRGELDKIIERSGSFHTSKEEGAPQASKPTHQRPQHERENPLTDLFDFF